MDVTPFYVATWKHNQLEPCYVPSCAHSVGYNPLTKEEARTNKKMLGPLLCEGVVESDYKISFIQPSFLNGR